jgi:Na+-driven multidrug efflux pump
MLMIGIAVGTGVGINALLSQSLRERNFDTVNKSATNGFFLVWVSGTVFDHWLLSIRMVLLHPDKYQGNCAIRPRLPLHPL